MYDNASSFYVYIFGYLKYVLETFVKVNQKYFVKKSNLKDFLEGLQALRIHILYRKCTTRTMHTMRNYNVSLKGFIADLHGGSS